MRAGDFFLLIVYSWVYTARFSAAFAGSHDNLPVRERAREFSSRAPVFRQPALPEP